MMASNGCVVLDLLAVIKNLPQLQSTRYVVSEVTSVKKRVLLAEDNPVTQMVAMALLKKIGLAVDVVADGSEAVKALGSSAPLGLTNYSRSLKQVLRNCFQF